MGLRLSLSFRDHTAPGQPYLVGCVCVARPPGGGAYIYLPTVRIIGTTKVQVFWSKPTKPNGEIVKYDIHKTQGEGETPSYSGIPTRSVDGKLTVNLTSLEPDTTYDFTVTAFTAQGPGERSLRTTARTGSNKPSAATATLIATICIFVIILSCGFMWEHRLVKHRKVAAEVDPHEVEPLKKEGKIDEQFPPRQQPADPFQDSVTMVGPFPPMGVHVGATAAAVPPPNRGGAQPLPPLPQKSSPTNRIVPPQSPAGPAADSESSGE